MSFLPLDIESCYFFLFEENNISNFDSNVTQMMYFFVTILHFSVVLHFYGCGLARSLTIIVFKDPLRK